MLTAFFEKRWIFVTHAEHKIRVEIYCMTIGCDGFCSIGRLIAKEKNRFAQFRVQPAEVFAGFFEKLECQRFFFFRGLFFWKRRFRYSAFRILLHRILWVPVQENAEGLPFLLVGGKVEKTFSVCVGQPVGLQNAFQL